MASSNELTIDWPDLVNEDGAPMLWFGSWLVGDRGGEGTWFHSGRGPARTTHAVPAEATGVRLRRWPNEGLAPEYADVIPAPGGELDAATISFEREQPFSLLAALAD